MSYAAQAHFNNYDPSSFGWPRNSDLVPLEFDGVNFGQCARAAHPVFIALLTDLVPHIEGGLHAGSCWSYAATDDLPDGSWSFHHYGTAIDVNWNVNQMGNNIPDAHGKWAIPRDVATALARKYGCEWGGNWSGGFHDNMHFEIHLTPAVARAVKTVHPLPPKETTLSAAEVTQINKHTDAAIHKQSIALTAVDPKKDSSGRQIDTVVAEVIDAKIPAIVAAVVKALGK